MSDAPASVTPNCEHRWATWCDHTDRCDLCGVLQTYAPGHRYPCAMAAHNTPEVQE